MKKQNEKPYPKIMGAYDFDDVIRWIEQKYSISTRHMENHVLDAAKYAGQRLDFYAWICENQFYGNICYGTYQELQLKPDGANDSCWLSQPKWVNYVLGLLNKEFPEAEGVLNVWVDMRE